MIITIQHAHSCLYCSKGLRGFFAKYNLDYSNFVKNGIEEELILATNDSMAKRVVEYAHGRS